MDFRFLHFIILILVVVLVVTACAPEEVAPTVDLAGTLAVQFAETMIAQTAAAASPTPQPSPTPAGTDTPLPTETAPPEPTKDPSLVIVRIINVDGDQPACRKGPGASYERVSYINTPKDVVLLGIGSVPGWYVIRNPYFNNSCWMPEELVEIDPAMDLSLFPVMYPGQ